MPDAVIANPILNGPFDAPTLHWRFDDDGITDEIVEGRRPSSYFVPVPPAKRKTTQLVLQDSWTKDRLRPNDTVNLVRQRVDLWRQQGRPGITATTRALLDHWRDPERERKLFFAQVEAVETAIYLHEAANNQGSAWIENQLREAATDANPGLMRVALKMATGSGKTTVMGMLIAWHALNKTADSKSRFSDAFLVVAPGITIRDRLRVLLPSDPDNVYRDRDLVPPDLLADLGKAQVVIANFHGFAMRETREGRGASKTTKEILTAGTGAPSPFLETPQQMVRRVLRELGSKSNIVVLNDEAHHCYRRRVGDEVEEVVEDLKGEDRVEAKERDEEARLWLNGLLAIAAKTKIRVTYDLSATPFFLRGSGYAEGTLFPWVVSDFSLIDAIESGLVKIPRVPVADDSLADDLPAYREIWSDIREHLPKRGRTAGSGSDGPPELPLRLQGALKSLYDDYARSFERWEASDAAGRGGTPPVFIVVCNNTSVSKLVYDVIAGWDMTLPDGAVLSRTSDYPLLSNVDEQGRWLDRPRTLLIDSKQIESGEGLSADFKKLAAREIEEFKNAYRQRFPGRDADELSDEDLLREVLNTVGKPDRLGEQVRCVVSVSMLTEGWDANTVTHILGVRAFGTQLLCEQVVGRGLRRRSYALGEDGRFAPEYAEVYGVPFSFIPGSGQAGDPPPDRPTTRVRSLLERDLDISFPRVTGYRLDITDETLYAVFDDGIPTVTLSAQDLPTTTTVAGVTGEAAEHDLASLKKCREQEVVFRLSRYLLETELRDDAGNQRPWYFPQVVPIVRQFVRERVVLKDGTFPGMLLLDANARQVRDSVRLALHRQDGNKARRLVPVLRSDDPVGSTDGVDFDTVRETWTTDPSRCPVSHVVSDSGWESKVASVLESLRAVASYVKNDHVGFSIPYVVDGEQRQYVPDFLVSARVAEGDTPLTVVVEVSGAQRRDKEVKVATAREMWVPAVNDHGGFGRWRFVEVKDPYDCRALLEDALRT